MPHNTTTDTKNQLLWYHCARCGSLFQSVSNLSKNRRCTQCGFSPNPPVSDNNQQTEIFSKKFESVEQRSQDRVRKTLNPQRTNQFIVKLVLSWVLIISLIIIVAKIIWPDEPEQKDASSVNIANVNAQNENLYLLNQSTSQCIQTMQAFLQAGLPEQSSQYVMQPTTAVARMTRNQDIKNLSEAGSSIKDKSNWDVVRIGDEKAIEAVWANKDGRRFDAIFRKERNEWLLDWEHFVRYSDIPLSVFLSGDGDAEGEFRLLARERLAEDRKNLPTISIVFYTPVFGRPEETVTISPEFLVDRKSAEGVLLEAAFFALKNGKRPFNAKLSMHDPDGMIRVRVKIRRSGEKETRKFELKEVSACHWYSSDLPGFDSTEAGELKN